MALPSHSTTLYDNGVPLLGGGGQGITGFEGAEEFVLSTSATIEGAQIYVLGGFLANPLTWAIYADSSSSPGAVIATGTNPVSSSSVYGVFDTFVTYYQLDFDLPSVSLSPGNYWLGLTFTGSSPSETEWVESTKPSPGSGEAARPIGGSWGLGGEQLAFQLADTPLAAPEPATWSLILSGVSLTLARRLRQRAKR